MRVAVVLFNLGGPASQAAVQPFLFNLFYDPAIIRLPNPFRWLLANFLSARRAPVAQKIYQKLGGSSPILGQTYNQASALKSALANETINFEVFVAMRYAPPRATDIIEHVKRFRPNKIVLLSLYPQFSTTTSRSSIREWTALAHARELAAPTATICCYPVEQGFIRAQKVLIEEALGKLPPNLRYRVIFSAHGLPQRVINSGDPYQAQIEQSASSIVKSLGQSTLDWRIAYQSRVGPLKWIGPSTEDEIKAAGREGLAVVVVPIAFTSEHSETLVELDMEYAALAHEFGVPRYERVPAVGTHPAFIGGLAGLVKLAASCEGILSAGGRQCPVASTQCLLGAKRQ